MCVVKLKVRCGDEEHRCNAASVDPGGVLEESNQ